MEGKQQLLLQAPREPRGLREDPPGLWAGPREGDHRQRPHPSKGRLVEVDATVRFTLCCFVALSARVWVERWGWSPLKMVTFTLLMVFHVLELRVFGVFLNIMSSSASFLLKTIRASATFSDLIKSVGSARKEHTVHSSFSHLRILSQRVRP